MDDLETYLLLVLSDSNLPTGSFVASSGLESYISHGFELPNTEPDSKPSTMIQFVRDSIQTYARSALPFVSDAFRLVQEFQTAQSNTSDEDIQRTLKSLDDFYESTTLNHVARRASKSQGVALLNLHSKGFSTPPCLHMAQSLSKQRIEQLIDAFKLKIRREECHGHLPICWGVLCAGLGLSLERTQYLHLFLHARSLLSAAVRLNIVGPYSAQQILVHAVKPLVQVQAVQCQDLRTGVDQSSEDAILHGPATTSPLQEILVARHDLQHSRIFNS